MLNIAAICLTITALLAYLTHRFVGLPTTIGVMSVALAFSLVIFGLDALGIAHSVRLHEKSFLHSIDFSDLLVVDGDPTQDVGILHKEQHLLAVMKGGAFCKTIC